MDAQLELKLIESFSLLEAGEPLDRILARYPEDAARLRALLETATALSAIRMEPDQTAQRASRRAFLPQAHRMLDSPPPRLFIFPPRLIAAIASFLVAFVFVGGTVAASASALPNEPLYSVKRAVEDAQLLLASGANRATLDS